MANLLDMLGGAAKFVGDLPGLLSPGSQAPIPTGMEGQLDPQMQAALTAQYKQNWQANQAQAIKQGYKMPGAVALSGAGAQDEYTNGIQKAVQTMQALREAQNQKQQYQNFQKMLTDPESPFTPQQKQWLSTVGPEARDKAVEGALFQKPQQPISGQGGIWVNDPQKGWSFQQQTNTGGVPANAHYDEKRAAFVWNDATGAHMQPVPGAKPDAGEAGKPQRVTIHNPDGTLQDQWVLPGQSTGTPIGDPYNPQSTGGSRVRMMTGRVLLSGDQAAHSLENVVNLPISADTGIFGGGGGSTGLLSTPVNALKAAGTDQENALYQVMVSGIQRNLATIESTGLAPPGSLTHQMDAVVNQPGNSWLTKLSKLAEARQIAEVGMGFILSSPDVSNEQKQHAQRVIDRLQKAVPFTQQDVIRLQYSQKPGYTLKDAIKDNNLAAPDTSKMPDLNY